MLWAPARCVGPSMRLCRGAACCFAVSLQGLRLVLHVPRVYIAPLQRIWHLPQAVQHQTCT